MKNNNFDNSYRSGSLNNSFNKSKGSGMFLDISEILFSTIFHKELAKLTRQKLHQNLNNSNRSGRLALQNSIPLHSFFFQNIFLFRGWPKIVAIGLVIYNHLDWAKIDYITLHSKNGYFLGVYKTVESILHPSVPKPVSNTRIGGGWGKDLSKHSINHFITLENPLIHIGKDMTCWKS